MTKTMTTHVCFRFMLIFAQCFAIMPVSGITDANITFLKFQWKSKRTVYSAAFALSAIINIYFFGVKMIREGKMQFGHCVTQLFFLVTLLTIIIFIDVAKRWPFLMKKWAEIDVAMENYGFPTGLHQKMKIISVIIITAAIVEHSLFVAHTFKYCQGRPGWEATMNCYFRMRFDYIFNEIKYNICIGILWQVLNIFSTISWNFMDLFIILISLCLSSRFTQVKKCVRFAATNRVKNEKIWRKLREDYTRLTLLCGIVDDNISNIILMSFSNNVFVILVQLFYSLRRPPSDGAMDKIYYVYSFSFLIIRLVAVALYADSVNSESQKPAYHLNNLLHSIYNIEIERFLYKLKYESVGLTGHKLFKVTRSLILSLAGAIVSYELVLIQFNVD